MMGALGPVSLWIPEDDILLKNAVEAGASLESLAKGAVHFSRRYTVRELHERWLSLLYDPVVSAEASTRMIEFERFSSALPPKPCRVENFRKNKFSTRKRKVESVRSCYYALRKRICNEPLNSVNLSFIVSPLDNHYLGKGDEPPYTDCIPREPISSHFKCQESAFDMVRHPFPDMVIDDACPSETPATRAYCNELENTVEGNFPVEQGNVSEEIPHILEEDDAFLGNCSKIGEMGAKPLPSFHRIYSDPGIYSEFGDTPVLNSPVSESGAPLHSFEYSSPLPEMPIWRTIEGISEPVGVNLPEGNYCAGDAYALSDDKNICGSGFNIRLSDPKMRSKLPSDELKCSTANTDVYLEELSNSLLNFTHDDELFINDDGKDVANNSYYDGLSYLLMNSPHDANQDKKAHMTEHEVPIASGSCLANVTDARCRERNDSMGSHEGRTVCSPEIQMPQFVSALKSQASELHNGVICCTLNTEDPEIPSNDDVFLPINFVSQQNFSGFGIPSSSVEEFSVNLRTVERAPNLMNRESKNSRQSHTSSWLLGPHALPRKRLSHGVLGCEVDCKLPKVGSLLLASGSAAVVCEDPIQIRSENVSSKAFKTKTPKEEIEPENHTGLNSSYSSKAQSYGIKQELETSAVTRKNQVSDSVFGSVDASIPETLAGPRVSVQEDHSSVDDGDAPYFSDIEALILEMDLDPDDQDLYVCREASSYQHVDTRRAIIRLEQAAHSHMQRAIASRGAFAVLYGRHSKHYIKKTKVLLGRATDDVFVDIDLGKEGRANKISRRQALINMDRGGIFHLKNLGKNSILVNNKEIAPGESLSLNPSCLIEIKGMPFIFEMNQARVKQYVDNIISSVM